MTVLTLVLWVANLLILPLGIYIVRGWRRCSPPPLVPRPPLNIAAPFIGLSVELVSTQVLCSLLGLILGVIARSAGFVLEGESLLIPLAALVSSCCTMLGGAVAVAVASHSALRHATALGVLEVVVRLLMACVALLGDAGHLRTELVWSHLVGALCALPAAWIGASMVASSATASSRSGSTRAPAPRPSGSRRMPPPLAWEGDCPKCRAAVLPAAPSVVCSGCKARHHTPCWRASERCAACLCATPDVGSAGPALPLVLGCVCLVALAVLAVIAGRIAM